MAKTQLHRLVSIVAKRFRFLGAVGLFLISCYGGMRIGVSSINETDNLPNPVSATRLDSCNAENPEINRRWSKLPLKMKIDDDVPERARGSILAAAKMWNDLFPELKKTGRLIDLTVSLDEIPAEMDGLSRIHWVSKDWWYENRFLAMASWNYDQSFMSEVDVYINAESFEYNLESEANAERYDLRGLLVHELGHALGLCHVEKTVMNSTLKPGAVLEPISDEIRRAVACLYADQHRMFKKICDGTSNRKPIPYVKR